MENYREKLKKGYITMEEYRVLAVVLTIEYLKINHEYEFVRKVGQGTYGVVVELKDPCKHHHFAAKIVLEEFVSKSEKEIWPYLCHDNLLPLISMEYITTTYCYVFITPLHRAALNNLVEGSELRKDNKGFEKAISWLHGICSGLQQLHKAKLSHLDIKLSNVLIDDDDRALLCDFGALTRTQAATDRYLSPFLYLPPEARRSENGRQTVLNGFQYDIYTLGMLCLELFTKQGLRRFLTSKDTKASWTEVLYQKIFDILQKEQFESLVKSAFPKSTVKTKTLCEMRDFIRGCINLNPQKRPTADDLLEHKIFSGIKDFRGNKYDAWLKRYDLNKLNFLVNLYIGHAVMMEFQSNVLQTNINPDDDLKQSSENKESVQTESEEISPICDNVEIETINDSIANDNPRQYADHSESIRVDSKDISPICDRYELETIVVSESDDDIKLKADDSKSIKVERENIYLVYDNAEAEIVAGGNADVYLKKNADDSESVHIESEDISRSCESCKSDENEFVEIKTKTKEKKFFDWLSRKKLGISKAFHRLCFCCCRQKIDSSS